MQQFFFSGSSDGKLDEKNRFVLPQQMRYGLIEEGQLDFTIGLGLGGCLAIYRKSDILKMIKKFQKNLHLSKFQSFFTLFFSTLYPTTCDKIGRVTLPARLKQLVKIDREIVIVGVLDKIEIWPNEVFEKSFNKLVGEKDETLSQMMEEAFSLLGEEEDHHEEH